MPGHCELVGSRQYCDGSVQLGIAFFHGDGAGHHLDRRRDANTFQSLAVDENVIDCQEKQTATDRERGRGQDCPFRTGGDHLAQPILLEAVGEDFLAAAGAPVDQHRDGLAPFHVFEFAGPVALDHLHRRCPQVEQVEVFGDRATPAVTQIPDQRIGVLQRALRYKVLKRPLAGIAGVAPYVDIANATAAGLLSPSRWSPGRPGTFCRVRYRPA
jgi:hypothetical protein